MIVKDIFVKFETNFNQFKMGFRLLKAGTVVWEAPVTEWIGGVNPTLWYWFSGGPTAPVDADKLVVRVASSNYPVNIRVQDPTATLVYDRQVLAQPSETLQDFSYDLPPTAPSSPPPTGGGGSTAPGSPVLLGGLSLDRTQVTAGEKVKVGVQIYVNSTFRGSIDILVLVNNSTKGGASTGVRDFLPGSYSVPIELIVPKEILPGTYPLTCRVLDQSGNILTQFTSAPVLEVLAAPPQPPPPTGVTISSLTVSPTQVKPGEKVTATAQVTVSGGCKGFMSFELFGITVSAPEKDWLVGNYPVSLEVTTPQNTPPGTYRGIWMVIDTQANKQLATKDAQVEVVAAPQQPQPPPPPTGVTISSLTVSPTQVKPGEKVTAIAQVTVSGGYKGLMSFVLFGITVSTPEKDWLAGNYPVSLEVTTPQNTPPGTYRGIWMVIDTQANKQLATKDAQVEVVAVAAPPHQPQPTANWLTPVMGVVGLALVGQLVMKLPKMLEKVGRK